MKAMSLAERTKALLREYQIFPNKNLGQHFIVEHSIFRRMADCASIDENDVVLDAGAGLGLLTRILASECKHVFAIESDQRLVSVLHEQLRDVPNVEIIHGDVLKVQLSQFNKIVSAPPYYISSSLILWLFKKTFDCAVLVFQKEFAKRLVASVGSEDYGWLAVVTYYYAEVELLDEVPRHHFYPSPEVNSLIVQLKPKKTPPFRLKKREAFRHFVQALFTERNRKVRNGVLPFIKREYNTTTEVAVRLANSLPFQDRRIRELTPEDFGVLANALAM